MSEHIHELAGEAYRCFERRERDGGEAVVTLKDGRPDWVHDIVRSAHGDFLPDDWRYETIREAFGLIEDAGGDADLDDLAFEFADGTDAYNSDLTAWLASSASRVSYCDESLEEFGNPADSTAGILGIIARGQYAEREEGIPSRAQGSRGALRDTRAGSRARRLAMLVAQSDLARLWGVSRAYVSKAARRGDFPKPSQSAGGRSLYRLSDCQAWRDAPRKRGRPPKGEP